MSDNEIEEEKINQGFDRNIDYNTIKEKLINEYNKLIDNLDTLDINNSNYVSKRRILIHKLIYLIISCLQLKNGSRISEACDAFRLFMKKKNINDRVVVKIAKSECKKYKKNTGESFITKKRNREMAFPKWFEFDLFKDMEFYTNYINEKRLSKRVLDYLLKYFNCNTHSLRYAFINYMLYELKRPMNDVAKFVGHTNMDMLVKYTQLKNSNQIFDLDE